MVGVAEDDLGTEFIELVDREPFDGRDGADGHEDRRLHAPVGQGQPAAPGRPVSGNDLKLHGEPVGAPLGAIPLLIAPKGAPTGALSTNMASP